MKEKHMAKSRSPIPVLKSEDFGSEKAESTINTIPELPSFRYESPSGSATVRQQHGKWYAFRKAGGKTYSLYLGALDEDIYAQLEQAMANLNQRIEVDRPKSNMSNSDGAKTEASRIADLEGQIRRLDETVQHLSRVIESHLGKKILTAQG